MIRPFLSVIIPTYNEVEQIALTLIELDLYLAAQEFSYELLVIDNDSSDATADIVKKFVPVIKNLKIINNPDNRGVSSAVKIGNLTAKGNWRLVLTSKSLVPISQFADFLPMLSAGHAADVLIAVRSILGAKIDPPLPIFRRLADYCLNKFVRRLLKSKVTDFLLDFQCFSESASEKILPAIKLTGSGYLLETLALAEFLGLAIKEVPVKAAYIPNVTSSAFNYLQMFWETLKIRWWIKRGSYHLESEI